MAEGRAKKCRPTSDRLARLSQLRLALAQIVNERKAIGDMITSATRKERNAALARHRVVKAREYSLELQIAEFEAIESGQSQTEKARAKKHTRLLRLRSRLDHADWLVWTRSIWKFKDMESRAKTGSHPAQFSAKVPERLIRMFSFQNDIVLDPFVGSGTTGVSALEMQRNFVGLDINPTFVELAIQRVNRARPEASRGTANAVTSDIRLGDARNLRWLEDSCVQLIVTHPPYWNAVKISSLDADMSNCDDDSYVEFLKNMRLVLSECLRVLQPDRVAGFLIGDLTRKVAGVTRMFPLHSDLISIAQELGWLTWDIYIVETKMRNSGGMPMMGSYPYPHKIFAQFAHNYLVILRKPATTEVNTLTAF